ncbi:ferrochelatase [Pelodictyon luteolum]|nr:ferrochelatase [Pelodictyon luteolum]
MRVAVILVAHGEAEGAGFFENYSMIRHTLDHAAEVMALPGTVRLVASVVGGMKNCVAFRVSGYRSPQNRITRQQGALLKEHLRIGCDGLHAEYEVYSAFHATPPFISDILRDTRSHDARLLVSMSPVDSRMTAGTLHLLAEKCRGTVDGPAPVVVDGFWGDSGLRRVYVNHVFRYGRNDPGAALLLAFHGTIIRDARGCEPGFHTGADEIGSMACALRNAVLADPRNHYARVEVTHYNHDIGGTWTRPAFPASLNALGDAGVDRADVFSCGYFSDGTETLLYAGRHAERGPVGDVHFLPCVNDSADFIAHLAARILDTVDAGG